MGGEQSGTMGSSLTKEQQEHLEALQLVLTFQNQPVSTSALVTFLKWLSKNVPEFLKTAFSFYGELWDEIGAKLREASITKDRTTAKLLSVWHQIMEGLKQIRQGRLSSDYSPSPSLPPPPLPLRAASSPGPDSISGSDPAPDRGEEKFRPPPSPLPSVPPPALIPLPPSAPPLTLAAALLPSAPP